MFAGCDSERAVLTCCYFQSKQPTPERGYHTMGPAVSSGSVFLTLLCRFVNEGIKSPRFPVCQSALMPTDFKNGTLQTLEVQCSSHQMWMWLPPAHFKSPLPSQLAFPPFFSSRSAVTEKGINQEDLVYDKFLKSHQNQVFNTLQPFPSVGFGIPSTMCSWNPQIPSAKRKLIDS